MLFKKSTYYFVEVLSFTLVSERKITLEKFDVTLHIHLFKITGTKNFLVICLCLCVCNLK